MGRGVQLGCGALTLAPARSGRGSGGGIKENAVRRPEKRGVHMWTLCKSVGNQWVGFFRSFFVNQNRGLRHSLQPRYLSVCGVGEAVQMALFGSRGRGQLWMTTPAEAVPVTVTPVGGCGGPSAPQAARVRRVRRMRRGMAVLSGFESGEGGFPAGDLASNLGRRCAAIGLAGADGVFYP